MNLNPSDIIAIASVTVSVILTLYVTLSDRRHKKRESTEDRINRIEDQTIGHSAQISVIVGGIQRLDARQERIEDLLFKAFGGPDGERRHAHGEHPAAEGEEDEEGA